MTLIGAHRHRPISELTDLTCKENIKLEVTGVEHIRVRENQGNWRHYQVRGRVNFLETCELQGRPGEYEVELDGHTVFVSVGLAHFTDLQVNEMVADLHEQEYLHDARAQGSQMARVFTALQEDIEEFLTSWRDLWEVVQDIVRTPAERLTMEVGEVGLNLRQRHTASTLALNLRTGRLTAGGEATHERLYALSDQVTLDTSENSHLVSVVQAYEDHREFLIHRTVRQIRSLELELRREATYQSGLERQQKLKGILQDVQILKKNLEGLEEQPLPDAWRLFRHKPSASTNRARFDERYRQVTALEERLHCGRLGSRPDNALELFQECALRATWELYEYWIVAKACEQLNALGFGCDDERGFLALEDFRGASYGLRENESLTFHHPSGLGIQLTYEQHVPWQENGKACILRPDVVLKFLNLEGEHVPLVLDAKYKSYTLRHQALARDLEKSARRYDRALGGAMAFLIHCGSEGKPSFEAWPSPSRDLRQKPLSAPFSEDDLPFKHGVVCAFPGAAGVIEEDVRPLRRILTAWLVSNGIFWICFSCGLNLRGLHTARETKLNGERDLDVGKRHFRYGIQDKWPKFSSYRCPCGGLTGMLTFCGTCGKGTDRSWQPIFKYLPREVEGNVEQAQTSNSWSKAYEIHTARRETGKGHLRHCSRCGA